MGLGDRADDRQPQPRAAATVAAAADEPLEHAPAQLGRDPGAVVLDDQHGVVGVDERRRPHVGSRRGVAQRVLDQVEHQPVEVVSGAVHDRGVGVDGQHVVLGHRARARPRRR